jgi:hypothetical protein
MGRLVGGEAVMTDRAKPAAQLGFQFWGPWSFAMIAAIAIFAAGGFYAVQSRAPSYVIGALAAGYTLAVAGLAVLPHRALQRRGLEAPMRAPQRRYMLRILPPMLLYCFALPFAISAHKTLSPDGVLAWVIALAPTIPVLFAIRAIVLLYHEEDDEYQRAKAAYAHVWATCLALAICTAFGFLQMFKLAPRLDLWVAFPLWALCLIPAQLLARRKFG